MSDIYTRYKSNPKLIFHTDDPEIDKLINPYLEIGYTPLSARYRLYKLISSGIDPQYDNINRLKKRPSEIIIDGMDAGDIKSIIKDTQKNSGLLQLDIDEKGRILSKIDMGRVKDIGSSIRGSDGIVYSTVVNDWKIRKLYYDYQKSKGEEPLEIKNDEVEKFIINFYGKNDELTEAVNSSLLRGIKARIDEQIAVDTGLDYISKQPIVGPISVGQGAIKFVNNLLMSFKEGVYSGLGLSDKDFDFDLVRKTAENISMINSAFPDIKVPKEKIENNIDTQLTRIIDLETKKRANFNSYITEVLPEVMGHSFGFFWEGAVELATLAKLGKSFKPLKFVSKLEQWGEKLQKLSPTFGELYRTARESKGVIKSLGYAIGKHTPTYLKRALQVTGQSYITQTFKGLLDYYDIPDEDEKWLYDIFINRQGEYISEALLIESPEFLMKKGVLGIAGNRLYNAFVNTFTEEFTNLAQDIAKGTETSVFTSGKLLGEAQIDALAMSLAFGFTSTTLEGGAYLYDIAKLGKVGMEKLYKQAVVTSKYRALDETVRAIRKASSQEEVTAAASVFNNILDTAEEGLTTVLSKAGAIKTAKQDEIEQLVKNKEIKLKEKIEENINEYKTKTGKSELTAVENRFLIGLSKLQIAFDTLKEVNKDNPQELAKIETSEKELLEFYSDIELNKLVEILPKINIDPNKLDNKGNIKFVDDEVTNRKLQALYFSKLIANNFENYNGTNEDKFKLNDEELKLVLGEEAKDENKKQELNKLFLNTIKETDIIPSDNRIDNLRLRLTINSYINRNLLEGKFNSIKKMQKREIIAEGEKIIDDIIKEAEIKSKGNEDKKEGIIKRLAWKNVKKLKDLIAATKGNDDFRSKILHDTAVKLLRESFTVEKLYPEILKETGEVFIDKQLEEAYKSIEKNIEEKLIPLLKDVKASEGAKLIDDNINEVTEKEKSKIKEVLKAYLNSWFNAITKNLDDKTLEEFDKFLDTELPSFIEEAINGKEDLLNALREKVLSKVYDLDVTNLKNLDIDFDPALKDAIELQFYLAHRVMSFYEDLKEKIKSKLQRVEKQKEVKKEEKPKEDEKTKQKRKEELDKVLTAIKMAVYDAYKGGINEDAIKLLQKYISKSKVITSEEYLNFFKEYFQEMVKNLEGAKRQDTGEILTLIALQSQFYIKDINADLSFILYYRFSLIEKLAEIFEKNNITIEQIKTIHNELVTKVKDILNSKFPKNVKVSAFNYYKNLMIGLLSLVNVNENNQNEFNELLETITNEVLYEEIIKHKDNEHILQIKITGSYLNGKRFAEINDTEEEAVKGHILWNATVNSMINLAKNITLFHQRKAEVISALKSIQSKNDFIEDFNSVLYAIGKIFYAYEESENESIYSTRVLGFTERTLGWLTVILSGRIEDDTVKAFREGLKETPLVLKKFTDNDFLKGEEYFLITDIKDDKVIDGGGADVIPENKKDISDPKQAFQNVLSALVISYDEALKEFDSYSSITKQQVIGYIIDDIVNSLSENKDISVVKDIADTFKGNPSLKDSYVNHVLSHIFGIADLFRILLKYKKDTVLQRLGEILREGINNQSIGDILLNSVKKEFENNRDINFGDAIKNALSIKELEELREYVKNNNENYLLYVLRLYLLDRYFRIPTVEIYPFHIEEIFKPLQDNVKLTDIKTSSGNTYVVKNLTTFIRLKLSLPENTVLDTTYRYMIGFDYNLHLSKAKYNYINSNVSDIEEITAKLTENIITNNEDKENIKEVFKFLIDAINNIKVTGKVDIANAIIRGINKALEKQIEIVDIQLTEEGFSNNIESDDAINNVINNLEGFGEGEEDLFFPAGFTEEKETRITEAEAEKILNELEKRLDEISIEEEIEEPVKEPSIEQPQRETEEVKEVKKETKVEKAEEKVSTNREKILENRTKIAISLLFNQFENLNNELGIGLEFGEGTTRYVVKRNVISVNINEINSTLKSIVDIDTKLSYLRKIITHELSHAIIEKYISKEEAKKYYSYFNDLKTILINVSKLIKESKSADELASKLKESKLLNTDNYKAIAIMLYNDRANINSLIEHLENLKDYELFHEISSYIVAHISSTFVYLLYSLKPLDTAKYNFLKSERIENSNLSKNIFSQYRLLFVDQIVKAIKTLSETIEGRKEITAKENILSQANVVLNIVNATLTSKEIDLLTSTINAFDNTQAKSILELPIVTEEETNLEELKAPEKDLIEEEADNSNYEFPQMYFQTEAVQLKFWQIKELFKQLSTVNPKYAKIYDYIHEIESVEDFINLYNKSEEFRSHILATIEDEHALGNTTQDLILARVIELFIKLSSVSRYPLVDIRLDGNRIRIINRKDGAKNSKGAKITTVSNTIQLKLLEKELQKIWKSNFEIGLINEILVPVKVDEEEAQSEEYEVKYKEASFEDIKRKTKQIIRAFFGVKKVYLGKFADRNTMPYLDFGYGGDSDKDFYNFVDKALTVYEIYVEKLKDNEEVVSYYKGYIQELRKMLTALKEYNNELVGIEISTLLYNLPKEEYSKEEIEEIINRINLKYGKYILSLLPEGKISREWIKEYITADAIKKVYRKDNSITLVKEIDLSIITHLAFRTFLEDVKKGLPLDKIEELTDIKEHSKLTPNDDSITLVKRHVLVSSIYNVKVDQVLIDAINGKYELQLEDTDKIKRIDDDISKAFYHTPDYNDIIFKVSYLSSEGLENRLGISRIDGAVFILPEAADVLLRSHGAVYRSAIKNYVYIRERGFYSKHAMFIVPEGDPLAKAMRDKKISILFVDKSEKLKAHKEFYKIEDIIDPNKTLEVDKVSIKNIHRIKEGSTDNEDIRGISQNINTTQLLINNNPNISEDIRKTLQDFFSKYVEKVVNDKFIKGYKRGEILTTEDKKSLEEFFKRMKHIYYSPASHVLEVSKLIVKVALNANNITMEDLIKMYKGDEPSLEFYKKMANIFDTIKKFNYLTSVQIAFGNYLKGTFTDTVKLTGKGYSGVLYPDIFNSISNAAKIQILFNRAVYIKNLVEALKENGIEVTKEAISSRIPQEEVKYSYLLLIEKGIIDENYDFKDEKFKQLFTVALNTEVSLRKLINTYNLTQTPMEGEVKERYKNLDKKLSKAYLELSEYFDSLFTPEEIYSMYKGIFDKNGRLTYGHGIISIEQAASLNINLGDNLITYVVPSDSPLSMSSILVVGILPQSLLPLGTVIVNSEYIQGLVGKDYDIDVIFLVKRPDDVTHSEWKKVCKAIRQVPVEYVNSLFDLMFNFFNKFISTEEIEVNSSEKAYIEKLLERKTRIDFGSLKDRLAGVTTLDELIFLVEEALKDSHKYDIDEIKQIIEGLEKSGRIEEILEHQKQVEELIKRINELIANNDVNKELIEQIERLIINSGLFEEEVSLKLKPDGKVEFTINNDSTVYHNIVLFINGYLRHYLAPTKKLNEIAREYMARNSKASREIYKNKIIETKKEIKQKLTEILKAFQGDAINYFDKVKFISDKEVRLMFMQLYLGVNPEYTSIKYSPVDEDSVIVYDMYTKEVGLTILLRELFSVASVVDIPVSNTEEGESKVVLSVKNNTPSEWNLKHLALLILTNDTVDFPTNDNKAYYLSDIGYVFARIFDLKNKDGSYTSKKGLFDKALNTNVMSAFNVPRMRTPSVKTGNYYKDSNVYSTIQYINKALKFISSLNHTTLSSLIEQLPVYRLIALLHRKDINALNKAFEEFMPEIDEKTKRDIFSREYKALAKTIDKVLESSLGRENVFSRLMEASYDRMVDYLSYSKDETKYNKAIDSMMLLVDDGLEILGIDQNNPNYDTIKQKLRKFVIRLFFYGQNSTYKSPNEVRAKFSEKGQRSIPSALYNILFAKGETTKAKEAEKLLTYVENNKDVVLEFITVKVFQYIDEFLDIVYDIETLKDSNDKQLNIREIRKAIYLLFKLDRSTSYPEELKELWSFYKLALLRFLDDIAFGSEEAIEDILVTVNSAVEMVRSKQGAWGNNLAYGFNAENFKNYFITSQKELKKFLNGDKDVATALITVPIFGKELTLKYIKNDEGRTVASYDTKFMFLDIKKGKIGFVVDFITDTFRGAINEIAFGNYQIKRNEKNELIISTVYTDKFGITKEYTGKVVVYDDLRNYRRNKAIMTILNNPDVYTNEFVLSLAMQIPSTSGSIDEQTKLSVLEEYFSKYKDLAKEGLDNKSLASLITSVLSLGGLSSLEIKGGKKVGYSVHDTNSTDNFRILGIISVLSKALDIKLKDGNKEVSLFEYFFNNFMPENAPKKDLEMPKIGATEQINVEKAIENVNSVREFRDLIQDKKYDTVRKVLKDTYRLMYKKMIQDKNVSKEVAEKITQKLGNVFDIESGEKRIDELVDNLLKYSTNDRMYNRMMYVLVSMYNQMYNVLKDRKGIIATLLRALPGFLFDAQVNVLMLGRIFGNKVFNIPIGLPKELRIAFDYRLSEIKESKHEIDLEDVAINTSFVPSDEDLKGQGYSLVDIYYTKIGILNTSLSIVRERTNYLLNRALRAFEKVKDEEDYYKRLELFNKIMEFVNSIPNLAINTKVDKSGKVVMSLMLFARDGGSNRVVHFDKISTKLSLEEQFVRVLKVLKAFINSPDYQGKDYEIYKNIRQHIANKLEDEEIAKLFTYDFYKIMSPFKYSEQIKENIEKIEEMKKELGSKFEVYLESIFLLRSINRELYHLVLSNIQFISKLIDIKTEGGAYSNTVQHLLQLRNKYIMLLAKLKGNSNTSDPLFIYFPKVYEKNTYINLLATEIAYYNNDRKVTNKMFSDIDIIKRNLSKSLAGRTIVSDAFLTRGFDVEPTIRDPRTAFITLIYDVTNTIKQDILKYYRTEFDEYAPLIENEFAAEKFRQYLAREVSGVLLTKNHLDMRDIKENTSISFFVETKKRYFLTPIEKEKLTKYIKGKEDTPMPIMTSNKFVAGKVVKNDRTKKKIVIRDKFGKDTEYNYDDIFSLGPYGERLDGKVTKVEEVYLEVDKPSNAFNILALMVDTLIASIRGFLNLIKSKFNQVFGTALKLAETNPAYIVDYVATYMGTGRVYTQTGEGIDTLGKVDEFEERIRALSQISDNLLVDVYYGKYAQRIDPDKIFDYKYSEGYGDDWTKMLTRWKKEFQMLLKDVRPLYKYTHAEIYRDLIDKIAMLDRYIVITSGELKDLLVTFRNRYVTELNLTEERLIADIRKLSKDKQITKLVEELKGILIELNKEGKLKHYLGINPEQASVILMKYMRDTLVNNRLRYINRVEGKIREASFRIRFHTYFFKSEKFSPDGSKDFDRALKYAARGVVLDHALYDTLNRPLWAQTKWGRLLDTLRQYNYNRMINTFLLFKEVKSTAQVFGLTKIIAELFSKNKTLMENPLKHLIYQSLVSYLLYSISLLIPALRWYVNPLYNLLFSLIEATVYLTDDDDDSISEYEERYLYFSVVNTFVGFGGSQILSLLFLFRLLENKELKEALDMMYMSMGLQGNIKNYYEFINSLIDSDYGTWIDVQRVVMFLIKEATGLFFKVPETEGDELLKQLFLFRIKE